MANKKTLLIGLATAVIIGGGIYLWYRSKKSTETEEGSSQDETSEKGADQITQPTNTPKKDKKTSVSKGTTYRGFKKGSLVYLKSNDSSIYSYPEFKGDNIIGNVTKGLLGNKPFAKFLDKADNKFIKVETIAFIRRCPPNARCAASLVPIKEIAYVPESFISNKPN